MNDNDIKKCKKNGYVWRSDLEQPSKIEKGSALWPRLEKWDPPFLHATREDAQRAICERQARAAGFEFDGIFVKVFRITKTGIVGGLLTMPRGLTKDDFPTLEAAQAAIDKSNSVESHKTQIGETQLKEVATAQTQKPTTVRGWLETIPDPAIREAAIRQCALPYKTCYVLCDAMASMRDWAHTEEGVDFWDNCYFAAKHNDSWPTYPPKEKQVKDGWTDKEIEKAAFKTKEWTDIPQVVTKRNTDDSVTHPKHYTSHPSGIECIQVTEHMNFCRGNAVKYIWRAGQKGNSIDKEIEDIAKAEEYCRIEKERMIEMKKKGGIK